MGLLGALLSFGVQDGVMHSLKRRGEKANQEFDQFYLQSGFKPTKEFDLDGLKFYINTEDKTFTSNILGPKIYKFSDIESVTVMEESSPGRLSSKTNNTLVYYWYSPSNHSSELFWSADPISSFLWVRFKVTGCIVKNPNTSLVLPETKHNSELYLSAKNTVSKLMSMMDCFTYPGNVPEKTEHGSKITESRPVIPITNDGKYIYYCKKCRRLFSGEERLDDSKCPTCKEEVENPKMTLNYWKCLSASEKAAKKEKWFDQPFSKEQMKPNEGNAQPDKGNEPFLTVQIEQYEGIVGNKYVKIDIKKSTFSLSVEKDVFYPLGALVSFEVKDYQSDDGVHVSSSTLFLKERGGDQNPSPLLFHNDDFSKSSGIDLIINIGEPKIVHILTQRCARNTTLYRSGIEAINETIKLLNVILDFNENDGMEFLTNSIDSHLEEDSSGKNIYLPEDNKVDEKPNSVSFEEGKSVIQKETKTTKDRLIALKDIFDSGLITEEEYSKKKDDILKSI